MAFAIITPAKYNCIIVFWKMKGKQKHIYFTVTNDLTYDQRMIKICSSLQAAGYAVTLVGRKLKSSALLQNKAFDQKRIRCFFTRGFAFYAEYNLRLFWYLMSKKMEAICAIDLDTIMPAYHVSRIKKIPRIYDAHEFFTEMKEIVTRPSVHKFWLAIERRYVPQYSAGYTVNESLAKLFKERYGVEYCVIANMARKYETTENIKRGKHLLYQGAVNEGRSFETLIPAMQFVDRELHIFGDGNFLAQTRELITKHSLEDKVFLKGKLPPNKLREETERAYIGLMLVENNGLNNYLSLANRFFDYTQAGTPQICVDFPAYKALNEKFEVALLVHDLQSEPLAAQINKLIKDEALWSELQAETDKAKSVWCWEEEEKKLIEFYKKLLP